MGPLAKSDGICRLEYGQTIGKGGSKTYRSANAGSKYIRNGAAEYVD